VVVDGQRAEHGLRWGLPLREHLLMAYLPPDQAVVGNALAVSYMEELYPVTVRANDATPLFDPTNERIKG